MMMTLSMRRSDGLEVGEPNQELQIVVSHAKFKVGECVMEETAWYNPKSVTVIRSQIPILCLTFVAQRC
jgi:hypothetical protein